MDKEFAEAFKEEIELDEMPNRANMERINSLIKKYSGKFKWRDEVLYVDKGIEKDVTSLIKKGGLTATVRVSSNPMREEVELDEASASVYKDMPKAPGKMVSNRVQVKAFKDTNAMGAFLSKQNDNSWQQTGVAGLKSGKYKIDMVKKGGKPSKNFIKVNEEVEQKSLASMRRECAGELEEGFSPKQIEQLKKAYASMPDRVPMDMANKMSAVLKGRSKEELIAIARADIKWLSTTAATNLIMQGVKAKEING